jgi:predicted ester cyclase
MEDLDRNKAVVERLMDLVDHGGDIDQLDELCTPDIVNHALAPGRLQGIEGTREFLSSPVRQNQSARWVERVIVAEGSYVVEYGVRAGDWPAGSFRGIEVPAGPYQRDTAFLYRLDGGRIAERWAVRDDLGLMLQLGAVLPGS